MKTACAVLALALVAGCGKTPKGQVVAIVNGEDISIQQINAEITDVAVPANAEIDPKQLRKVILDGLIDRRLQVEEAQKQGLDKTAQFAALKKRNEEELLASMLGHKVAQTVPLPAETEVRQYMDNNPLKFARRQRLTIDQLSFVPPRDTRRLAVLANAHTLEQADVALRGLGIATTRGTGEIDTAQSEDQIAVQLDRAPPGEPLLLPQGDRLVIGVITAREPIEVTKEDAYLAAARAVRASALLHESKAQLLAARDKADIWYEPGWGPGKAVVKKR